MSHELTLATAAFIREAKLFPPGARLLVAVSGGLDSIVLLHVLRELAYPLTVAHYNYRLRDRESDGDARFVASLAARWGLLFRLRSSKEHELRAMREGNLQALARQLRYDWLDRLKTEEEIEFVCTAHHLEDNLETLLLQLSRGTSLSGLAGMSPSLENGLRRPFLNTSRSLLEDYARQHGLAWREDRTNATDIYKRNYLRHHLTPGLLQLLTDGPQRLSTTFARLRADKQLFTLGMDALWQKASVAPDTIDRKLLPEDPDLSIRLLTYQLRDLGFKGDQFRQLLQARSGTILRAAAAKNSCRIEVKGDLLYLYR